MEAPQTSPDTPMGQPISSDPKGPQYVPQPLGAETKPGGTIPKRLIIIIAAIVAAIVLVIGGMWLMGQSGAKEDYKKAVAAYKQTILTERDALNNELDSKDIGASEAEARPIFEAHGKKLQEIVAAQPKKPKVLGFIPVSVDKAAKDEATALTKAASDYANALLHDVAVYNYYLAVTEPFKPIRALGTITAEDPDKVDGLGTHWPTFLASLKAAQPPADLQSMHNNLITQSEVINEKIKQLVASLDTNTFIANDKLLGELSPLTKKVNETFNEAVLEASKKAFDQINSTYDALDEHLKK